LLCPPCTTTIPFSTAAQCPRLAFSKVEDPRHFHSWRSKEKVKLSADFIPVVVPPTITMYSPYVLLITTAACRYLPKGTCPAACTHFHSKIETIEVVIEVIICEHPTKHPHRCSPPGSLARYDCGMAPPGTGNLTFSFDLAPLFFACECSHMSSSKYNQLPSSLLYHHP